jgi:hypothetical protein
MNAAAESPDRSLRLSRTFLSVVGTMMLLDSLSQLALATVPWQPEVGAWRATVVRLALTQVTPICLSLLFLTLGLVRTAGGWRRFVNLALAGFVISAALVVLWWSDAKTVMDTTTGPALAPLRRASYQALTSGIALGLMFLAATLMGRSAAREPAPSAGPAAGR